MVKLKDIINLIHDNDVRIVDELGTGVYLLQGNYSSDAISVEYLNREVTWMIWVLMSGHYIKMPC